jgi:hypothetical protein
MGLTDVEQSVALPTGENHIFSRRMTGLRGNSISPDVERFWRGHANRTVGDDYSVLKKKIKCRKQIADKIGVGFELPNSILASVVRHVPKMAAEQAEQALAKVFVICEIRESASASVGESVCPYRRRSIRPKQHSGSVCFCASPGSMLFDSSRLTLTLGKSAPEISIERALIQAESSATLRTSFPRTWPVSIIR